jgi:hypothetical protein
MLAGIIPVNKPEKLFEALFGKEVNDNTQAEWQKGRRPPSGIGAPRNP